MVGRCKQIPGAASNGPSSSASWRRTLPQRDPSTFRAIAGEGTRCPLTCASAGTSNDPSAARGVALKLAAGGSPTLLTLASIQLGKSLTCTSASTDKNSAFSSKVAWPPRATTTLLSAPRWTGGFQRETSPLGDRAEQPQRSVVLAVDQEPLRILGGIAGGIGPDARGWSGAVALRSTVAAPDASPDPTSAFRLAPRTCPCTHSRPVRGCRAKVWHDPRLRPPLP